jgi:hypothetical protein
VNETRRHHGFALVLVLVLASASFQVAAPDADWSRLVTIFLGAATLSVSVWAARATHAVARVAAAAGLLLALLSVVLLIVLGEVPQAEASLVNGLLIAFAPVVVASGVLRDVRAEGEVSLRTLSGVLAIYLLLGMLFSFFLGAAAELGDAPFFTNDPDPTRSDLLYFSYVTLSTVGYGDLSPLTDVGRMLAIAEALIGQIYLVTVVALIVTNLRPRGGARSRRRPPPEPRSERPV